MYVNDGRGGFEDRRADVGLAQPTAAMTGFGVAWLDADNDGTTDLLAVNGAVTLIPELRGQPVPYRQRNQLFRGVVSRASPGTDGARIGTVPPRGGSWRRGGTGIRATGRGPRSRRRRYRQRRLPGCGDHQQRGTGAGPPQHGGNRPRMAGPRSCDSRAEPVCDRSDSRGRRRTCGGQASPCAHRRQLPLGIRPTCPRRPGRPSRSRHCRHHLARRHPPATRSVVRASMYESTSPPRVPEPVQAWSSSSLGRDAVRRRCRPSETPMRQFLAAALVGVAVALADAAQREALYGPGTRTNGTVSPPE